MSGRWLSLAALVGALLLPTAAAGRPGTLDPSFGHNGQVFSRLGDSIADSRFTAMVRRPNGDLLLEGTREAATLFGTNSVIERRGPSGQLDPSFGKGGKVVVPEAAGLAVQRDERILVGQSSAVSPCRGYGAVLRLNLDGSKDRSFGKNGCSAPVRFEISHIVALEDGRILVAGLAGCSSCGRLPFNREIAVARFLPDGSRDPSFGDGGSVLSHNEEGASRPTGLASTEDGGVLVSAGRKLVRLTTTGAFDRSFGSDGEVEIAGATKALFVLGDGRIVLASTSKPCCSGAGDFTISRFRPDGSLDPSFATAGTATLDVGVDDIPAALAPGPDGSVLLAGESGSCFPFCSYASILARFDANGLLDSGYGDGNGIVNLPSPPGTEPRGYASIAALATGPEGSAVVAGGTWSGSNAYLTGRDPNGQADLGFGSHGSLAERHRLPSNTEPTGLAIEPNGEIVVAAGTDARGHEGGRALLDFKPNGKPDRRVGSGRGFRPTAAREQIQAAGRGRIFSFEDEGAYISRFDDRGRIDTRYGSDGKARLPAKFRARSFLASRNGTVIVVGRVRSRPGMAAYRLTRRGKPDPRFGKNGLAIASFGPAVRAEARALLIQPGGRIVLTGWARASTAAARLLPDGKLDRSFGRRGLMRRLLGYATVGTDIAAQGRGGIVIASTREETSGKTMAGIVRLTHAGRRDYSFGRRGVVQPSGSTPPMALFADRRRIVLLTEYPRPGLGGVVLRAYRPDGAVDRGFGRHGRTLGAVGQRKIFQPVAAARQPDGRIVVAGTAGAWLVGNQAQLLRFR